MNLRHVTAIALATMAIGSAAEEVSRAQFDAWMEEISNWGRWGENDELGTLNLVTPAKSKAAVALVREGVTVSMAHDLSTVQDEFNANPFEHVVTTGEFSGHQVAGDQYSVQYHGFAHSHIDGLPHFAHKGKLYNGFGFDTIKPTGATKLGIHNVKNGIVTRGVLVDMAWFKGVDYLEPGTTDHGRGLGGLGGKDRHHGRQRRRPAGAHRALGTRARKRRLELRHGRRRHACVGRTVVEVARRGVDRLRRGQRRHAIGRRGPRQSIA